MGHRGSAFSKKPCEVVSSLSRGWRGVTSQDVAPEDRSWPTAWPLHPLASPSPSQEPRSRRAQGAR